MPATESTERTRKQLGAWYTPHELVDIVVERTVDDTFAAPSRHAATVRVLDPACGDGRFLKAVAARLRTLGRTAELTGVDVDPRALARAAAEVPAAELTAADALALDWGRRRFDVVVGNPPFLSQLATATTRGGSSRHGGGPYADAAAEFLALALRLAEPRDGRLGLVLPQSILASRDAGPVRDLAGEMATMTWSWWSPRPLFDAQVVVCALGFRRGPGSEPPGATWSHVVTQALGVPALPVLAVEGTVGDRASAAVDFRDEYYGLVPAVSDAGSGPPLVTSGLIDPGRCHWGARPVRFAKCMFAAPRVDVGRLDARMRAWARRRLVPKVLVANQTRVVEAVADPLGKWLPGVPVTSVVPMSGTCVWELAAVLGSPVAAAAAWHATGGTGLSARAIRLGPAVLASVPWPAGELGDAARLLRAGDVEASGRAAARAYRGVGSMDDLDAIVEWWRRWISGAAVARSTP